MERAEFDLYVTLFTGFRGSELFSFRGISAETDGWRSKDHWFKVGTVTAPAGSKLICHHGVSVIVTPEGDLISPAQASNPFGTGAMALGIGLVEIHPPVRQVVADKDIV